MKTSQQNNITEQTIREALTEVMDPEIPYLSIVDLGIVRNVKVADEGIEVEIMPTFVPAAWNTGMQVSMTSAGSMPLKLSLP